MTDGRMQKQIVVRVPADLLAALQTDADENGRTLAQTVRFHLRKAFPPQADPRAIAHRVFGIATGGNTTAALMGDEAS